MSRLRFIGAAAVILVASLVLGGGRHVQADEQQSNRGGAAAIGNLIDVIVNNTQALNNITALNGSQFNIVNLNDVLNGNETNILSGILNNSQTLSQNTVVVQNILNNSLNNNTVLSNFLNNNDVTVGQVVALNVLSGSGGPVTLYTFQP